MKRTLFVVLFFVSCANLTSPVKNQQAVSSKEALILTYSQSVRDSALNLQGCPIGVLIHPHPYSPDSMFTVRMKNFVQNEMSTQPVVLLSDVGLKSTLISDDINGGVSCQFAISRFPFVCIATEYDGTDSTRLAIDSIDGGSNVFLKIGDKPVTLNRGDSLVLNDTVYGGDTSCRRRMIITKRLNNAGRDSLPNDKYRFYF